MRERVVLTYIWTHQESQGCLPGLHNNATLLSSWSLERFASKWVKRRLKATLSLSCRAAFRPQTSSQPRPASKLPLSCPNSNHWLRESGQNRRGSRRSTKAVAQWHLPGKGRRDAWDGWGGPPLAPVLRRPPAAPPSPLSLRTAPAANSAARRGASRRPRPSRVGGW